jgi:hypothetical protein
MSSEKTLISAPVHAVVMPPFAKGQKIVCVSDSWERDWNGRENKCCMCGKGYEYEIDGCVWSHCFGWLVSISGELHAASDFRSA